MTITISLPDEFLDHFKDSLEELQRVTRVVLAIELYLVGGTSLNQASKLSDLSTGEFWEELLHRKALHRDAATSAEDKEEREQAAGEYLGRMFALFSSGMIPRNPERIDLILEGIRDLWHEYPDQRLGQLLRNHIYGYAAGNIFNIEDNVVLESLGIDLELWPKSELE